VRLARWAALDGWGRQNAYELRKGRFDIRSDGADGRPGGEGANADILFSGQPPLSKQEVSRQGIIPRAAHALGLAAQAEHIDVHGPNWRRCDRTYADLEIPAGPAAKELHGLLDIVEVRSVLSRAIALALTVISLSPGLARVSKLILAEALDATWEDHEEDDPLTNVVQSTLIDFRNAAVKEELLAIFEKPSPPASIGILYGAGHMEGIERDLRGLGYVLREETWHAAIVVKPEGVAPAWDIAGLIAEAVAARVARRKPARKSERD